MKLRVWQSECINLALNKYLGGQKHFLALATPGAGKTVMASELANKMLSDGRIDLVICFSPASIVANDFCESLQTITKERFDGLLGAKGSSLTYQSLQYLDKTFWQLFSRFRVFVIFDEIHHCAGSNIENANAWGEQIIRNIKDKATYTLALTGTPWRTDTAPITLSNYLYPSNKISCDYVYGLAEAIQDDVCRIPKIVAIDNSNISIVGDEETKRFNSFKSLLSESAVSYQSVIENEEVIKYILLSAQKKLSYIRSSSPSAAGLIVASSVEHANNIANLLKSYLNEECSVVTYRESEPTEIIQRFRHSSSKWIVSVGMISEGTNIPRLQVCCHLTNIKTEMHFRQILGRILRITSSKNQNAVLYMPAQPKLLEYAYRVKQDVPFEADVVKFDKMKSPIMNDVTAITLNKVSLDDKKTKHLIHITDFEADNDISSNSNIKEQNESHFLTKSYEQVVNIFGRFKQETLALGFSELK
jgi:superfamily II DNA or RNA helicase